MCYILFTTVTKKSLVWSTQISIFSSLKNWLAALSYRNNGRICQNFTVSKLEKRLYGIIIFKWRFILITRTFPLKRIPFQVTLHLTRNMSNFFKLIIWSIIRQITSLIVWQVFRSDSYLAFQQQKNYFYKIKTHWK